VSRRLRLCGECGQTAAGFLGVILVVAAMVGVIAASDIGGQIAAGVCRVPTSAEQ
jgi:hypothetical protein